jgi:Mrp family chromosome partitioning ATPase
MTRRSTGTHISSSILTSQQPTADVNNSQRPTETMTDRERPARTNKKTRIDPEERVRDFLAAISADLADAESDEIFGVMRDVPNPYSGQATNVVIRNADNVCWTNCITELNDPNKRDRVAVVGTPGIGKSTTAFYLVKL